MTTVFTRGAHSVIEWLNANSGAVTAVVTAIYAFFTILLWRATGRQATLTKQTFAATNRPYLSLRIEWSDITVGVNDVVEVQAIVENVGTIPAEVTKWEASGRLMNLDSVMEPVEVVEVRTLRGDSVFPGEPYPVEFQFRHPGIAQTPMPLRFVVTLGYRGVSIPGGKTYETVLEGERTPTTHRQRMRAT
jgi:hypothetical protein